MYDPEISLTYDSGEFGGASKYVEMKLTGDKTGGLLEVLGTVVEFLQAAGFVWLGGVTRNEANDFVIYCHKVH